MPNRFKSAWSNYGGKSRIIHHYPAPKYPLIIEPFAGAGAYAMRWTGAEDEYTGGPIQCWLNDLDPTIYAMWKFLTLPGALSTVRHMVPDTVNAGDKVSELLHLAGPGYLDMNLSGLLALCQAEANQGTQGARGVHDQVTSIGAKCWPRLKRKLEWVIPHVKDFKITNLDYLALPDIEATWFVDPPYDNEAGRRYRTSGGIDYQVLAEWCKSRKGQVIVCEGESANWLPFRPLMERQGIRSRYQKSRAMELVWTND